MKNKQIYNILDFLKRKIGVGTDKELCEKLGWKYGTLDTWKRRDKIPVSRLYKVAKQLNIDINELMEANVSRVKEGGGVYNVTKSSGSVKIPIFSAKVSAGGGNNIESIDEFKSGEFLEVALKIFKVKPGERLGAIQVDGDSMIPRLLPDSWVIFRECSNFEGDGLYVLNYDNVLMVKLLEVNPNNGNIYIKSVNPAYSSWEYNPSESSVAFRIIGKVVRSIV